MRSPVGLTNPLPPLPQSYNEALGQLQEPQLEQAPQISLPQVITSALMATLAGALTDNPQLSQQVVEEPFVRKSAVEARNLTRRQEYEKQRSLLLREGAREASTAERQSEVAAIRAEAQRDVADIRAETAAATEAGRNERAAIANQLREAQVAIAQGRLADAQERTKIQKMLANVSAELSRIRGVEATERTKKLSESDTREFRAYARDYVAQAVTAIQNTPEGEDVTWTMILPDRDEELTGAEEIKTTILAYIDSTMKGSPGYDRVRKEAEEALTEAIRARE